MTNHRKLTPGLNKLQVASRSLLAASTLLLISAVLGGLLGSLLAAQQPVMHTATSVMLVESDATALADPLARTSGADPTGEAAFMSGEIARLNSDALGDQVSSTIGARGVKYNISQIGTSGRVSVTVSDPDPEVATKAVDAMVKAYQKERRSAARAGLQRQQAAVDRRLGELRGAPSSDSLNTEIGRLLGIQSSTSYALGQLDRLGAVDTPTYLVKPSGLSSKVILPILLALVLTMLMAGLLAFARGTDRLVRAPKQLGRLGIRVLFPVVSLDQPWVRKAGLQSLVAQLPAETRSRLLLVDVDGRAGAASLAEGLRESDLGVAAESTLPGQLDPESPKGDPTATIVVARLGHSSLNRTREVVEQCTGLPLMCAGVLLTVGDDEV